MCFPQTSIIYLTLDSNRIQLAHQLIQQLVFLLENKLADEFLTKNSFPLKRVSSNPFSKKGGFYIIYCEVLSKIYIGHGTNYSNRKSDHSRNIKCFFNKSNAKRFKLNIKIRSVIENNCLTLGHFRFCPLHIIDGYEKQQRELVASIEVSIIEFFLQNFPKNIWNVVAQDALKDGATIRSIEKGGSKAKKITDGFLVYNSISDAAKFNKVSRKTIRNRIFKTGEAKKEGKHWSFLTH